MISFLGHLPSPSQKIEVARRLRFVQILTQIQLMGLQKLILQESL